MNKLMMLAALMPNCTLVDGNTRLQANQLAGTTSTMSKRRGGKRTRFKKRKKNSHR